MTNEQVEAVAIAIAKVIGRKSGNVMSDWITPARLEEAKAAITAYEAISAKPGVLLDARNEDAINYYGSPL